MRAASKTLFGLGILLAAIAIVIVILLSSSGKPQPVTVRLWDGSMMRLVEADRGRKLYFGGAKWQKGLFKGLGIQCRMPNGSRGEIINAHYTNAIGLFFSRNVDGRVPSNDPTQAWNGSGQLYYVDGNGSETFAMLRGVWWNFDNPAPPMMSEGLIFEIPYVHDPELHFRLFETNRVNGAVTTNDFKIRNPVL